MLTLRSIFLYLDRTHAISTAGVKSLFEMGLQLFRKHLAEHPEVRLDSFFTQLGLLPAALHLPFDAAASGIELSRVFGRITQRLGWMPRCC